MRKFSELRKSGRLWPIFIVGILTFDVAIAVVLIYISVSDPTFAVEEDYYEKAVAWDDHARQVAANEELGWNLSVFLDPLEPGVLRADLTDRDGKPVDAANVSVIAFHNAFASKREEQNMDRVAAGMYRLDFGQRRPGVWEFRFDIRSDGQRFTAIRQLPLAARRP